PAAGVRTRVRQLSRLLGRDRPSRAGGLGGLTSGALLELARKGPTPLDTGGFESSGRPTVAAIVPSFRRGSGGHATIVHLLKELRELDHDISLWLEDGEGRHLHESPAATKRSFDEFFHADGLPLHTDFTAWRGADIV